MSDSTTTSVAIPNALRVFNDDELASITSFHDAALALQDANVEVESNSEYGNGFVLLKDKTPLVGVSFVILEWRFNEGDFGDKEFVSASVVTAKDEKFILNDGSTGLCAQLRRVTDQRIERGHKHPQAGLMCEHGLTKTSYYYNEDTKETSNKPREGKGWGPASTFYLAD